MGDVANIPNASNYAQSLNSRGFDSEEIVALASLETFGEVNDPVKRDSSQYPKLDNYVYKQLLAGPNSRLHL